MKRARVENSQRTCVMFAVPGSHGGSAGQHMWYFGFSCPVVVCFELREQTSFFSRVCLCVTVQSRSAGGLNNTNCTYVMNAHTHTQMRAVAASGICASAVRRRHHHHHEQKVRCSRLNPNICVVFGVLQALWVAQLSVILVLEDTYII